MCIFPTPTGGERTRRLIDAPCCPEPGTPLPVPLPFGRGEGASSAVLVHTEVPGQGEAMARSRSFLNSTAVLSWGEGWVEGEQARAICTVSGGLRLGV